MSQGNVDLVRSIYADWERGDYSSSAWADPRIEFAFVGGPAPGSWAGVAGMAEAMREWLSAWEEFRGVGREYRELDEERVLVLVGVSGRGKNSGLEITEKDFEALNLFHVFHVHDEKVTRLIVYWDRDRALADLGLEE
jgi:ketosteroid isomerase-like protein